MNWGKKIVIIYVSFVGIILFMVVMAMNQKIDLVAENYYDQELKYQDKIDGNKNFNQIKDTIAISIIKNNEIQIHYPESLKSNISKGTVQFVKQSDNRKDFISPIIISDNNQQTINHYFQKGIYKVSFDWKMNNKPFYFEQNLVF